VQVLRATEVADGSNLQPLGPKGVQGGHGVRNDKLLLEGRGAAAKLATMIILDELGKSGIELSTGSRANIRRRVVRGALNLPPNLQACDLRAQRLDGSDQIYERKV
jgi:hypothetical protein